MPLTSPLDSLGIPADLIEAYRDAYSNSGRPVMSEWFEPDEDEDLAEEIVNIVAAQPKATNPKLIKEMEADLTDLLFHLFKDQPRISRAGYFSSNGFREGSRHFERDAAVFRGMYVILYKRGIIGQITCRPHKVLRIPTNLGLRGKSQFAQSMLIRLVHDQFPGARIEGVK